MSLRETPHLQERGQPAAGMAVPQQLLASGKMKPVAGGQLPEQAVLLGGCSGRSEDKTPGPVGTLPDAHHYSSLPESKTLGPVAREDGTLGRAVSSGW